MFWLPPGSGSGPPPDPVAQQEVIDRLSCCNERIIELERQTLDVIGVRLSASARSGRDACDWAFAPYMDSIVLPFNQLGLISRAVRFSRETLIPAVLDYEKQFSCRVHKGALFFNTALASLVAGDDAACECFLAMGDEEDRQTSGASVGETSLRRTALSRQLMEPLSQLFLDWLEGSITKSTLTFERAVGSKITVLGLEHWRQTIDDFHHLELCRILRELYVFSGNQLPNYSGGLLPKCGAI
jgi:hypothetical protein